MRLYRFVRVIVYAVFRLLFRTRMMGTDNVPPEGAYLIVASHRSLLDIPFAAFVTRRRVRFLAKRELFANVLLSKVFRTLGGIPVQRGEADSTALKACVAALADGEPVAIFAEGTRHSGPTIKELYDGAAWMALRAGVPIVPVGIAGSEAILAKGRVLPKFERVAIVIGTPIDPGGSGPSGRSAKRADVTAVTGRLHVALQQAFDEAGVLRTARR